MDIQKIIDNADNETLAKWWCELNKWEWPEVFGEEEKQPVPISRPTPKRDSIMEKITQKITFKECLRYWNKDTLPGVEFDEWWNAYPQARK